MFKGQYAFWVLMMRHCTRGGDYKIVLVQSKPENVLSVSMQRLANVGERPRTKGSARFPTGRCFALQRVAG